MSTTIIMAFVALSIILAQRDWRKGDVGRAIGMWIMALILGHLWVGMWLLRWYFRGYV